jgi:uncharacterized protein YdbL (DUF1318 family)
MNVHFLARLLVVFAALAFGTVAMRAQDLNTVKARMEQRLGAVNAMKDRGVAGENNRGFLEARGGAAGGDQRVIGEENADRRTVYAAIAAQTKATPDAVGRQRAQQIAAIAQSGHWIQDPNGTWRQK